MSNLLKRCLWGVYFFMLLLPTSIQGYALQQKSMNRDNEIDATYDLELETEILSNYMTLTVNWGINSLIRAPQHMDLAFWRSRVAGANVYYNIPIKSSHFTVSCGAGISNADYVFKEGKYMIDRDRSTKKTIIQPTSKVVPTGEKAEKSMLSIWYTDLIAELGFNSNKEEPQEGFFVAVGGNIGLQLSPSISVQYGEDKESKTQTLQERFNLSEIRAGLLARMGWGRFGAFYAQTLTPLFTNDQGPTTKPILPFSIGISVNLL
jgi:hypothetical protein